MRKTAVIVFLVLCIGTVAGFQASIDTIDRSASHEDPAEFTVKVENNLADRRLFQVHTTPRASWFNIDNPVFLEPGESHEFDVTVTPPENTLQQNYLFSVFINAGDQTEELNSNFEVESLHDLTLTSISSNKNSYKPGEEVEYELEILNTENERITEYSVVAESMGQKAEEKGLPLEAGSRARMTLSFKIPENASPGGKDVEIQIGREEGEGQTLTRQLEVEEIEKIDRSTETDNRIFFYSKTLSVENQGNSETTVEMKESLPSYLSPITSFEKRPESTDRQENINSYTWSFSLEPGESRSVSYTVNYWIPLTILVILISGLLVLKKLRKPVSLAKRTEETEEGIKIQIELENRSSEPMHNIEVVDFVPDIASLKEEFPMAKPVIRKTSNGTRLTWKIDELEPGSQRVFEYKIEPLFEVEGEVTLPEAKLESGDRKMKESDEVEANFRPQDT